MAKPDLSTYGGFLRDLGYAGGLVDMNDYAAQDMVNDSATAIDFGVFVARSGAAGANDGSGIGRCKAVGASTDVIVGLSIKFPATQVAVPPNDTVLFNQYDAVPVLRRGWIYAIAYENVTQGDQACAIVAQTGQAGTVAIKPAAAVAPKGGGNTGNGVFTIDGAAPVGAGWKAGIYRVIFTKAVANAGDFEVLDPSGNQIGVGSVGVTFNNQIKFAIADGSADFIVGDEFDVTLSGRIPAKGCIWETTTLAGNIGIISADINN